jgi:hypothetical protein
MSFPSFRLYCPSYLGASKFSYMKLCASIYGLRLTTLFREFFFFFFCFMLEKFSDVTKVKIVFDCFVSIWWSEMFVNAFEFLLKSKKLSQNTLSNEATRKEFRWVIIWATTGKCKILKALLYSLAGFYCSIGFGQFRIQIFLFFYIGYSSSISLWFHELETKEF